jgi:hypothetical protein
MLRAGHRYLCIGVGIAVAIMTTGCSTDGHPRGCDVQQEAPGAVLALDAAGSHRYVFLASQQFTVVGEPDSPLAVSSSPDVASVTGSDVGGGHRYTRFFAHAVGETTVSRRAPSGLESAKVVVVCHLAP